MIYRLFIGSSHEQTEYAESVQLNLSKTKNLEVIFWRDISEPSNYILEDILNALQEMSFGLFILGPDDYLNIHGEEVYCARDNVVLELGMYLGALGRSQTFFMIPEDSDKYRIASDLKGLNFVTYKLTSSDNKDTAVSTACTQIKRKIQKQIKEIKIPNRIEKFGVFPDFDYLYKDLFRTSKHIITSFIHSRRWRESNLKEIELFLKKPDVHWDVILPDISQEKLVFHLKEHFDDGRSMVSKIIDAYDYFNQLAKRYPNKIKVYLFPLYPVYTFYKFDNTLIISQYPLSPQRKPTPTFMLNLHYQFDDFFEEDIQHTLGLSSLKTIKELDDIININLKEN